MSILERRWLALAGFVVIVCGFLVGWLIYRRRNVRKRNPDVAAIGMPIFAVHPGAVVSAAAAGASHVGLVSLGRTFLDGMNILLTTYYLREIAQTPSPASAPKDAHADAEDDTSITDDALVRSSSHVVDVESMHLGS